MSKSRLLYGPRFGVDQRKMYGLFCSEISEESTRSNERQPTGSGVTASHTLKRIVSCSSTIISGGNFGLQGQRQALIGASDETFDVSCLRCLSSLWIWPLILQRSRLSLYKLKSHQNFKRPNLALVVKARPRTLNPNPASCFLFG